MNAPLQETLNLPPARLALYNRLESQVGNTPLYKLQHIDIPNGCTIYCKEEYRNPTGSHYDRETVRMLRGYEEAGKIKPGGKRLVETTTGSSGASFAWMCRVLGYKCTVFIPEDMPAARIEQIRSYGAEVVYAPVGRYIGGLVGSFKDWWDKTVNRRTHTFTNHSMDGVHSPEAMRGLGREILDDFARIHIDRPDYFVTALGNGISARGAGEVLLDAGTTLVGMEPYESPSILAEVFPGEFERRYPEGWPNLTHNVYGTGPGHDYGVKFTNMEAIKNRISEIRQPRAEEWRSTLRQLMDIEAKHVGNSSAACVWAALDLANDVPANSTILTIFYDAAWRYLPLKATDSNVSKIPVV